MKIRLRLTVAILGIAPPLSAGPAEDEAVVQQHLIRQLAPLHLETVIVKDGAPMAAIVLAEGEMWSAAAQKLRAAIAARTRVELPLLAAGQVTDKDWADRTLIVLGNLMSSPAYARLYNNYFVCADAAYSGAGGYELRTVHNPWGTGRNVIALGAQDAAGASAGADRLVAEIARQGRTGQLALGRLLVLHLQAEGRRAPIEARLSVEDVARMKRDFGSPADKSDSEKTGGSARSDAYATAKYAMQYHRTGDEGWFELFRFALERQLRYYDTEEYIKEEGPRRYDRDFRDSWAWRMVVAWDLLEEHPGWTDAERLRITNHLLRLVFECNMKNGWDSTAAIARWMKFDSIPHNHQTWPGLANLFGGWYFTRHYQLPIAGTWLKIAQRIFHSGSRSSKAWEDAAGYDWVVPRHILVYAFASGDHTFIDQGHAAELVDAVLMSVDSLGHQPPWGACEYITRIEGIPELLGALEQATGDGRVRWLGERLRIDGRGEVQEPRWTVVAPVSPQDHIGIKVRYLPKPHFDLLGSPELGGRVEFRAPNIPYHESFDKLVLRDGLGTEDDYLMLDGYAAGSHGHLDGNAIIGFTSRGAHWLVDGEYIRDAPKYHCAVTVLKDGVSRGMPTNVRLESAGWFGDGALVRTTMPGYNGITWTRNIIHVAKSHVAVIDELTAEVAGDYDLRCAWRVLGEATLKGKALELRQGGRGFTLLNLTGQSQELVYVKNSGEHIYYREAGLPIHQLNQRITRRLAAGETVRIVNVLAAGQDGIPDLRAWSTGEGRGAVVMNGQAELFGVAGLKGEIDTDARLYRVTPDAAWLAGATRYLMGGRDWLGRRDAPLTVRLSTNGIAYGEKQPVPEPSLAAVEVVDSAKQRPAAFAAKGAIVSLSRPENPAAPPASGVPSNIRQLSVRWDSRDLASRPVLDATNDRITAVACADLNGDGHSDIVIGTQAGAVVAVGSNGRELWRTGTDGPITALTAGRTSADGEPRVFYGTDNATLGVLSREGQNVARTTPPGFRNVESRARNITLADLDRDGKAAVVVGCESWQYMAYALTEPRVGTTSELSLTWKCVFYAHAATVCHVSDLDGDGYQEIIGGNDYFCLQIINHLGKVIAGSPAFGPEQTALASAPLGGAGGRMVLVGTDAGDVIAFDIKAKKLWSTNVGDRVTGLDCQMLDGKPQIVASSEGGRVWGLDLTGQAVWQSDLGGPVKRLARDGDNYVALTPGGLTVLAPTGMILGARGSPQPVVDMIVADGTGYMLMADGNLQAVKLR